MDPVFIDGTVPGWQRQFSEALAKGQEVIIVATGRVAEKLAQVVADQAAESAKSGRVGPWEFAVVAVLAAIGAATYLTRFAMKRGYTADVKFEAEGQVKAQEGTETKLPVPVVKGGVYFKFTPPAKS